MSPLASGRARAGRPGEAHEHRRTRHPGPSDPEGRSTVRRQVGTGGVGRVTAKAVTMR
jgi:hypothetical protein